MGLCPKTPTHRNARPESQSDGFPERGLNGAYKVPQAHLPPPGLPRFGGGERPPFLCKPPAPLTITMGQRPSFRPIIVPRPNPRDLPPPQALTPRGRYPRSLITRPSEPLSRHRERGWGEWADTPVATLGAILCAVRIDFRLPPQINPYPAQPATGVLGQSPKRILPTFVRTKVGPRRVGVQIKTFCKALPAVRRLQTFSRISADSRPPTPLIISNLSHQITPIYLHHLVDFSPKCKLSIKNCCFLTFLLQKIPVLAVLVEGLFLPSPFEFPPERSPLCRKPTSSR